ncbi:MAG: hypothetical protein Q4B99_01995 [Clostridia bacterium]|nr:hypothetical protein [Clostridia bacterium]
MHNRSRLTDAAAKRQKYGNTTLLVATLGALVCIVGLFLTQYIGLWAVAAGGAAIAASIVVAAVLVDPYEKRFYEAFCEEYLYPELDEVFSNYEYLPTKGMSARELREMAVVPSLRRHVARCLLRGHIRGTHVSTCHLLYAKDQRVNKKSKLPREAIATVEGQALRLKGIKLSAPSLWIRPRGVYETEGVRVRNKRPEMLLVGAGTQEFQNVFEALSPDIDAAAEFLDEAFCHKLLRLREIVKFMSPNSGLFIRLRGDCCELFISNWDNGCMPTMKDTMSSAYFEKCAVYTVAMADSCVRLLEPGSDYAFNPEVEL